MHTVCRFFYAFSSALLRVTCDIERKSSLYRGYYFVGFFPPGFVINRVCLVNCRTEFIWEIHRSPSIQGRALDVAEPGKIYSRACRNASERPCFVMKLSRRQANLAPHERVYHWTFDGGNLARSSTKKKKQILCEIVAVAHTQHIAFISTLEFTACAIFSSKVPTVSPKCVRLFVRKIEHIVKILSKRKICCYRLQCVCVWLFFAYFARLADRV